MNGSDVALNAENHPCFAPDATSACAWARIHLPVARDCTISCVYCDRKYDCVNESRPGVTSRLLTPDEACSAVAAARIRFPNLTVAAIAGPGDPLANPAATFATFRLLRKGFADLHLCLSTNGLALPQSLESLHACGVGYVTVTVNAVDPSVGSHLYQWVREAWGGRVYRGREGAALLLERQKAGVLGLRQRGIHVKINTVVTQFNRDHVPDIAREVASWGAERMNCIPVLPLPTNPVPLVPPSPNELAGIRAKASVYLPQMSHCSRCRADATGPLAASVPVHTLKPLPT